VKLLLVEDSPRLQDSISRGLRNSGHLVDLADDGHRALAMALARAYDAIVLDLMLPGLDGMSVLQELRKRGKHTLVLILTAKSSVGDRVRGLRSGADDYLCKPFSFDELLARIETLGRRLADKRGDCLSVGDLVIDLAAKTVERSGEPIGLAPREYRLLEHLARRRGNLVSRAELEEHLYDQDNQVWSNAVDSAICALRAKIDRGRARKLIHTRRGFGYLLGELEQQDVETE
jgi:DNA-binding response OmpR family regulator